MKTGFGSNKNIYLDYNATAPIRPEVLESMVQVLSETGNPSSVHKSGRMARAYLERARDQVAELLNAQPRNIIFTSGGTEADMLALLGIDRSRIIISTIEHDAIFNAVAGAIRIPVTPDGVINLRNLENILKDSDDPSIISVMWANNETGAIQPIKEIVALGRQYDAIVHSDAVQAVGKLPIDFSASGLDMMSVSAHKFGGPKGVGALVVNEKISLKPIMRGGGQERGLRSGTENLPGIVGFGTAAVIAKKQFLANSAVTELRDLFELSLKKQLPQVQFLSSRVPRIGNTSSVVMPGVTSETQVMALDLEGIEVSAGAACSSGKMKRSHVIDAMYPEGEQSTTSIRVSFGWGNTIYDVDQLVSAWLALYKRASKSR